MRSLSRFLFGLLGAGVSLGLPASGFAQGAPANGTVYGDWQLACQATAINETACAIAQTISLSDGNRFLAEVTLQKLTIEDSAERIVMALTTPTNMLLTAQPGYRVGTEEETLPLVWRTCTQQLCTASRVLEPAEVDALRSGVTVVLGYQSAASPEPIIFELSLNGVSAGLDALSQ